MLARSSSAPHPPSPCPDIFSYEGAEPENNRWYGEISLRTDESLVGIRLDIELDRPSDLMVVSFSHLFTDNIYLIFRNISVIGLRTTKQNKILKSGRKKKTEIIKQVQYVKKKKYKS